MSCVRSQIGMVQPLGNGFSGVRDTVRVSGLVPGRYDLFVQHILFNKKVKLTSMPHSRQLPKIVEGLDFRRRAYTGTRHILRAYSEACESRQTGFLREFWKIHRNSRVLKAFKRWCFGYARWVDRCTVRKYRQVLTALVFRARTSFSP